MDYFPRKSLSKYLIMDTIDFNKHVHDIDIFINDKWRKYAGGDIGRLFKFTRRLELRFWPMRKRSQPSQGDFFALQREPCMRFIYTTWQSSTLYATGRHYMRMITAIWDLSTLNKNHQHYMRLVATTWKRSPVHEIYLHYMRMIICYL